MRRKSTTGSSQGKGRGGGGGVGLQSRGFCSRLPIIGARPSSHAWDGYKCPAVIAPWWPAAILSAVLCAALKWALIFISRGFLPMSSICTLTDHVVIIKKTEVSSAWTPTRPTPKQDFKRLCCHPLSVLLRWIDPTHRPVVRALCCEYWTPQSVSSLCDIYFVCEFETDLNQAITLRQISLRPIFHSVGF